MMKNLKTLAIAAPIVLASTLALASSQWTETYKGMGSDSNRDNACSSANNMAGMNAAAACMGRRGSQTGQTDVGCNCQCNPLGDSQVCTCTDTIQVSCQSNR